MSERHRTGVHGRYLFVGSIAVAPLLATWLALEVLFSRLVCFSRPAVVALAEAIRPHYRELAALLPSLVAQSAVAAMLVLLLLYVLGWPATRKPGRHFIFLFDGAIARVPIVNTNYRNVKKLLAVVGGPAKCRAHQFISPEMKAIELVMRLLRDSDTDQELAMVYAPASPNQTSGYLEIVPVSQYDCRGLDVRPGHGLCCHRRGRFAGKSSLSRGWSISGAELTSPGTHAARRVSPK